MSITKHSNYSPSIINIGNANINEVRAICSLKQEHWQYGMNAQLEWWAKNSSMSDSLVRLIDNGELIAFLRLRQRPIYIGERVVTALCATEICVRKSYEGRGIGRQLMDTARSEIGSTGTGYLLCSGDNVGFYLKCGWKQQTSVNLRASSNNDDTPLTEGIYCLTYDPRSLLNGPFIIEGSIF